MFHIKINDHYQFEVEKRDDTFYLSKDLLSVNWCATDPYGFHLLYNNKSYRARILAVDQQEKTCTILVNGNKYHVKINDQFDLLLRDLGFDHLNSTKIADLKAPMPGLVLKVLFEEGDSVKKGETLFILEAMKMENSIKAITDLKIKSIKIKAGDKVEKNQVMMIFA